MNKPLALEIPFIYSAYKVFINGEEATSVGAVSAKKATHETNLETKFIPFQLKNPNMTITIQVSSLDHMRGGIPIAPSIGEWDQLNDVYYTNNIISIFTASIIFIAGILTLLIGLMNRSERALLIFGFFCLFIAIRAFFTTPFLYHYFTIDISFLIAAKIEYLTTNLAFICYAIFIYLKFKNFYSKKIVISTVSLLVINSCLTIFCEPLLFETVFFTLLPIKICFADYSYFTIYQASKQGDSFAKLLLFGILIVLITMIVDHLSGIGIITLPQLLSFSIVFNVFLVILSLSQNYVAQVYDLTALNHQLNEANKTLDEKVHQRTQLLHEANLQLSYIASYDSLTGIFNRRSFEHELQAQFDDAQMHHGQLSFIMIDIDQFKLYNDEYGHVAGDQLIIQVVNIIKEKLPNNAIFSRYGGEEFSIIMPNYPLIYAAELSELIRKALFMTAIPHK